MLHLMTSSKCCIEAVNLDSQLIQIECVYLLANQNSKAEGRGKGLHGQCSLKMENLRGPKERGRNFCWMPQYFTEDLGLDCLNNDNFFDFGQQRHFGSNLNVLFGVNIMNYQSSW